MIMLPSRIGKIVSLCVASLLAVSVAAGCAGMTAGTDMTRTRDPAYRNLAFRHVAVFADVSDLRQRKLFENAVVSELQRQDIHARSSMEILPPTRDYTVDERVQTLVAAGADGVLVISGESGIESVYVPVTGTQTTTTGNVNVQGNMANYHETARTEQQGGYTIQKPWSKITTRLVDLDGGRTAWLAYTETRGSGFADFDDIRKSYARSLAKQIRSDRIVATQRQLDEDTTRDPPHLPQPISVTAQPADQADAKSVPSTQPPASTRVEGVQPAATPVASSAAITEPVSITARLEGCIVAAQDGQFLGKITVDPTASEGIGNLTGRNGSKTSKTSIFNPSTSYGGPRDPMSAFNPAADSPPSIFCRDHFEAFLTTNAAKSPAVDPRLLVALLRSSASCPKGKDCR
jgi:hypothetical protein